MSRSLLLLLSATACTVGPDHAPPAVALPATFHAPREPGLADGAPGPDAWWRAFDDHTLDGLITQALAENRNLGQSLARLDAARALRGVAGAAAWPTVDARGSYEHRQDSDNTPFGAFIPKTDIHAVGFDATWELDLWGRVRRSVEAATADLDAAAADLHGMALTVAAEVARTYVDLRAAQRRTALAEENLRLQEQTLTLVQARLAAGLVGERDVAQATTNVATTRARLPQLAAAEAAARNRLAVLLGRAPGTLTADLGPAPVPRLGSALPVGAPADLLLRRPDVRAAERRLAAAVARIGIAEADRYPRISLFGTLGLAADGPEHLFARDSLVAAIGPSLRWNLFDAGRKTDAVRAATAAAEAERLAFEQAVLLAVEETENAMVRFGREQARRDALARAAAEARRAVDLAQTQYREGLSDFQTVLDSERVVAAIEDDLASSEAAVAGFAIALCKALGGGPGPAVTATAAR